MPHGYDQRKWDEAKSEARDAMIAAAQGSGRMSYSDLVGRIRTIELHHQSPALDQLLSEISVAEDKAGRGMLSVVVVRHGADLPGEGFFTLAKTLGRDTREKLKCWSDEAKRVYAVHRK